MKILTLLFFFIALTSTSYGQNKEIQKIADRKINIDNLEGKLLKPKDYLSEMSVIRLAAHKDYLIREPGKIVKFDDSYYIMDFGASKTLYAFSAEGAPLRKFNNDGSGLFENQFIVDFDVTKDKIYLLTRPSKVIILNRNDFKVDREISLHGYYDRLCTQESSLLLYSHHGNKVESLDLSTDKIGEAFKTEDLKGYSADNQSAFHRVGGQLFFQAYGNDIIYEIGKGLVFKPLFELDYSQKKAAKSFYKHREGGVVEVEEIIKFPLPSVYTMFRSSSGISILYSFIIFKINSLSRKTQEDRPFSIPGGKSTNINTTWDNKLIQCLRPGSLIHLGSESIKGIKTKGLPVQKSELLNNSVIVEFTLK